MAHISVFLSDALVAWAERQVVEGRGDSVAAYVADLIARDMDDAGRLTALNAAVEEGLASEPIEDSIADIIAGRNRDGDGGSDVLDVLRLAWAQGIDSGAAVDGNFAKVKSSCDR